MSSQTTLDRLISKSTESSTECWTWNGSRNQAGYGNIWVDGACLKVHRVSWTLYNGPIPIGLKVLHTCDNPSCWNPEHLFIGTQKDNMQDMLSKGRGPDRKGISNGRSVLSELQVIEILKLIDEDQVTMTEIACTYNVSHSTIGYIKRKGWRHLKDQENE